MLFLGTHSSIKRLLCRPKMFKGLVGYSMERCSMAVHNYQVYQVGIELERGTIQPNVQAASFSARENASCTINLIAKHYTLIVIPFDFCLFVLISSRLLYQIIYQERFEILLKSRNVERKKALSSVHKEECVNVN